MIEIYKNIKIFFLDKKKYFCRMWTGACERITLAHIYLYRFSDSRLISEQVDRIKSRRTVSRDRVEG